MYFVSLLLIVVISIAPSSSIGHQRVLASARVTAVRREPPSPSPVHPPPPPPPPPTPAPAMSLDPFEARLQFLKLLRTLNASQQSIQKVVSFAVKYGARCGEDLWECVEDEVQKGSLNARINILYFLDSLADTSAALGPPDAPYLPLIERSLPTIVAAVVPDSREGVLNLKATRAILDTWLTRRVIDPAVVEKALAELGARKPPAAGGSKRPREVMGRSDVLRRIEEDRERQKRLRERMWILPIPPLVGRAPSPASPFTPASPRGTPGASATAAAAKLMPPPPPPPTFVSPLDVEFDQMWETTSDLDDDDFERMREWVGVGLRHADSQKRTRGGTRRATEMSSRSSSTTPHTVLYHHSPSHQHTTHTTPPPKPCTIHAETRPMLC
ncbi:hypothetical protein VHUM_02494 [Vanrija humicola]|uniref:CID domain-containing protein n=1 Tax=Vanrija humicola TaxID=5417 RepID=A0A7D8YZT1_VANHU|nr:hypothetical protein VHUM_02494 [Vanrija humicola]